jgi:hypothetical protein
LTIVFVRITDTVGWRDGNRVRGFTAKGDGGIPALIGFRLQPAGG